MTDVIDITPNVHFLNSIRGDRGSWATLVAEGVDNSLDANASEVAIDMRPTEIVIADNGCGIAKAHESAIVRLGEHQPHASTKLGRFGIGIKYNATSAGDLLEVESISSDGDMQLRVDWSKVIQSGRWQIPRPRWQPVLVARGTGTTIQISRLRWDKPKDKDIDAVREQLAQMFYPAIEQGATLRVNGRAIPLLREPVLTDVVEETIQLPSGKGGHVRAGILARPEASSLYGVQLSYKHRVILSKSNFGCNSYSGTRRMFARIVLTADWGLSRFKDQLVDDDAEQFETNVEDLLRPILEKCHSAQMELKVDEMTERLNDLLPLELQATRPPRRYTVTERRPRKPSTRHGMSDRDDTPTGPARKPKSPLNRLLVTFEGPICQEYGYGHFTKGRPNRITLATDNPDVAALLAHRDSELAARALLVYALMIYHHARDTDPQITLPFEVSGSFGLRVWQSAIRQDAVDVSKAQ